MKQSVTYNIWIGSSCDYGNKERAGGAAVIIESILQQEQDSAITDTADLQQKKHKNPLNHEIAKYSIAEFHTTEFRIMLTLMAKVMEDLPEKSCITFLTNVAYINNFDKDTKEIQSNKEIIQQCINLKKRHKSVCVKIVKYHKSPLLIETHEMANEAMKQLRRNKK